MNRMKEYKALAHLELETTKMRHTTFTAILSISFILPGFALRADSQEVLILFWQLTLSQIILFLGFLFYAFAVFHYAWYHRYSHRYRKQLKVLEPILGFRSTAFASDHK